MGTFTAFPAELQPILQTGFLEREFKEGLDSQLAYRRDALRVVVNARLGETLTMTRTGRFTPVTTPTPPQANFDINNNLTPQIGFPVEQYTFTMQPYKSLAGVNLMQELAGVANQFKQTARNLGVQAAQSLERIAQNKLFSAYLGGNTFVRTDLGASSTTTCHVDDIRGFQTVLVNGVPTAISSANPLAVTETGTVTQTLSVTAATADSTNASASPGGISGVLTFAAATAPAQGDALIAAGAPKIIRPGGKVSTNELASSDTFNMGVLQDAITVLKRNAVPAFPDGGYHCVVDPTSMRQLWSDQAFMLLFQGRPETPEYRFGDVIALLGALLIPSTETYLQAANTTAGVLTSVNRPILYGMEHLVQGTFEGLDIWLDREGFRSIGEAFVVNDVAMVIRPPIDASLEWVTLLWMWIGDFVAPTDATATPSIIPTSTGATWKRAVVIETSNG